MQGKFQGTLKAALFALTCALLFGVDLSTHTANATGEQGSGTPTADLSISKDNGVTMSSPGELITYTIIAANAGPSPVIGAIVNDTFPSNCFFTRSLCSGSGGGTCPAETFGNLNVPVNLPVGASVTFAAMCVADATPSNGTLSNTVTISPPAGVVDPLPDNNSATDTDMFAPRADLRITVSNGVSGVRPGTTNTYTITAINAGPSVVVNAIVKEIFPDQCDNPTWTCQVGTIDCAAPVAGVVTQPVSLSNQLASKVFTATCDIPINAFGSMTNAVTIDPPPKVPDPTPGDNAATDTDQILSGATLTAAKQVAGTLYPSGTAYYDIYIHNAGPGWQSDNPGDEFVDVLPAGLTFESVQASRGTAIYDAASRTVRWNGELGFAQSDANLYIRITARINDNAGGVISNQATIYFDSNGDGTNDSTALSADVLARGGSTVFVLPEHVPALAIPGMLIAALLLLFVGWRRSTNRVA